jgi:ABC-type sugar transport system ATPase subunit
MRCVLCHSRNTSDPHTGANRLLSEPAKEGAGVIFISQEVSEMIGMSDRVLIWKDGRIIKNLERNELSKERVLSLIIGA